MGQYRLPGSPPIPLVLRRSARARRISLRISQLDGRVTLTLPRGVPDREALDFASSKADWIRGHLGTLADAWRPEFGRHIPVEGQPREIAPGQGRGVRLLADRIELPPGAVARRLHRFLKELARDRLAAAADDYAGKLGQGGYTRLTIRDTRSRWGSCSSQGGLMFSWRLILSPPEVLNYVAAHEVAHLAEMNHSPAFWSQVERIHGPYAAPRAWLHQNGVDLHRYRFEDAQS